MLLVERLAFDAFVVAVVRCSPPACVLWCCAVVRTVAMAKENLEKLEKLPPGLIGIIGDEVRVSTRAPLP